MPNLRSISSGLRIRVSAPQVSQVLMKKMDMEMSRWRGRTSPGTEGSYPVIIIWLLTVLIVFVRFKKDAGR